MQYRRATLRGRFSFAVGTDSEALKLTTDTQLSAFAEPFG